MQLLPVNFIQFLLRLVPFAPSIGGMIVNIIIVIIAIFVAFQLNLCSYLPTSMPFENLICNRLLQGILIYVILKMIFGKRWMGSVGFEPTLSAFFYHFWSILHEDWRHSSYAWLDHDPILLKIKINLLKL